MLFNHKYRLLFITLLALYAFLNTALCNVYYYFNIDIQWWHALLVIFAITFLTWEGNRLIKPFMKRKFLADGNKLRFFGLFFIAGNVVAVITAFSIVIVAGKGLYNYSWQQLQNPLKLNIIYATLINLFLHLVNAILFFFREYKQKWLEAEELRSNSEQAQLQLIKSQINPHFLFNSLNTLSSLIAEDEEKAEKFLNEMTKVYRYMLRSDDEPLVTLDTELKFIESYLYLLKARFGDGIDLKLEVAERDRQRMIPALSLQVLLENAFTRNTLSKQSPLSVEICTCAGDRVLIKHNRQEKTQTTEIDTEAGLDNLVRKYALLDQSGVDIEEGKLECCYKLPLIIQKEEVVI